MVCVPAPAAAGLNWPPLTPGPLYVPPVGVPPINVKAVALTHTVEFAGQLTVGNGFTVIVNVQLLLQPVVGLV